MLSVKNLTKKYADKVVLKQVNFDVSPGKIFGLLGPNGAGKTTTLRIISNILTPDAGTVTFEDEDLGNNFFNRIGYLPEDRGLHKRSKVKDILYHFAKLKGLSNSEIKSSINFWSKKLNIVELLKMKSEQLSKGNQQKVQIISSILHNPDLIIFDEPFSGFDPINQSIIQETIKELSLEGKTIIISTHMMNYAEVLCDSVCLLNNGSVILSGNLNQIKNEYSENLLTINFLGELNLNNSRFPIMYKESNRVDLKILNEDYIPEVIREICKNNEVVSINKLQSSLHEIYLNKIKR